MEVYDAVVVGAGHNGLACAVVLASAGWTVLVLERNDEPGGAVRTAEVTLPGFHHDLMATNLNLFAGSPFFAEYGEALGHQGLEFVACDRPFSSVFPGGGFVGVSTDTGATLESIAAVSPADARAWSELADRFGEVAPHLFPLLGTTIPSARAVKTLYDGTRALGITWPWDLARLVLQSSREFVEEHFVSPEIQALCASWGMHLDFPPDAPGGALFPFLESFASHLNGMVLGRGGARTIIDAMTALLASRGGQVRVNAAVAAVTIDEDQATGIELTDGQRIVATRAVIANITPQILFQRLIPESRFDAKFNRRVSGFRHAPGTMMIHCALDELPNWAAGSHVRGWAYVHVGPYMEDMNLSYQQAVSGLLPARPTLVIGQPTAVDPSRAPRGKHVLWIQVRMVPGVIRGDATGEIEATAWADVKEVYADRIIDLVEEYAPGLRSSMLGRHVMSPVDLEMANPNLIGGDSLGGSHHPMQFFGLRPFPGWTKYRTPVANLYMCGASTWPGAGVGAGSGYLLAKRLVGGPLRDLRKRLNR